MEQTIQNLAKAFVGESQARNRYTIYASVARKEGYEQIAALFLETADQEREHASVLYKFLTGLKAKIPHQLEIEAVVPVAYGTTLENIKAAMEGENYEWGSMYPDFSEIAKKEGLQEIATKLKLIATAEKHHAERYGKLLAQLEKNTVFKKEEDIEWTCRQCGYVHKGKQPPLECPLCGHAKGFYQRKVEEY